MTAVQAGPPPGSSPPPWMPPPRREPARAGVGSQVAAYAVCAAGILIAVAAVSDQGDAVGWGVATALALGVGAVVGATTPAGLWFRSLRGGAVALFVGLAWVIGTALLTGGGDPTLVLLAGPVAAFTLGLDWRFVERLRPLPFVSGFLVLAGVSSGESWTYAAGTAWLLLAIGTLALLEADARAALAHVAPVTPNPDRPPVATRDLVSTAVGALALAAAAALLLSAPSCRNLLHLPTPKTSRSFSSTHEGSGSGAPTVADRQGSTTVRDGQGDYWLPQGAGRHREVPVPDGRLTGPPGTTNTERPGDGTVRTYRYDTDGNLHLRVDQPDGSTATFDYRPGPGDTTKITERDADGNVVGRYTYDPKGRPVDGSRSDGGPRIDPPSAPKAGKAKKLHLPDPRWFLLLLALGGAVAGLVWWLRHREPPVDGGPPSWAIELQRRIEEEGRRRGRARGADESVVAYARALAEDALPDERLVEVGAVVSSALFRREGVDGERRLWAEATFTALLVEHPRERRARAKVSSAG